MKFNIINFFTPKKIDFTSGNLKHKLFIFAFPLIINTFLQILFASCDTLFLSYFGMEGHDDIASLTISLNLINLIVNIFAGLCGSMAILFADAISKKQTDVVEKLLSTAIFMIIVFGIVGIAIIIPLADKLLWLIKPDTTIIGLASQHFRLYFIAFPAVIALNLFLGVLYGIGDSKSAFYGILIRISIQTSLCAIFVIGLRWGILGVGLATMIAIILQTSFIIFIIFTKYRRQFHFSIRNIKPSKKHFFSLIKHGVFIGINSFLVALANTSLQSAIGFFGQNTNAIIAGCGIASLLSSFVFNSMGMIGIACMTAISQNYGVFQYKRIREIIKYCLLYVCCVFFIIGIPLLIFGQQLVSFFLFEDAAIQLSEAIGAGWLNLIIFTACSILYGVSECLNSVIGGIKKPQIVVLNTIIATIIRISCTLILIYAIKILNETTFIILIILVPSSWLISTIFAFVYLHFIVKKPFVNNKKEQKN